MKGASRRAARNIKSAFPEKTEAEILKIVDGMWDNLGRIGAEYTHFRKIDIFNDSDHFEVKGLEILNELKEDQKPAVLFAGHLANWGIVSMTCVQAGLPIAQVYRRFNNPLVDWIIGKTQHLGGMKTIWKGAEGGREAFKTLKQGDHLVMFVDQKLNEGELIPFFGRPAMTPMAPARLALKMKCPLVPIQVERLGRASKFRITIHPPLPIPDAEDPHQQAKLYMTQVNKVLESWIRQNPDQWFWVHNRWPK